MTKSHPWRSLTLAQIYAKTLALRKLNAEWQTEIDEESKMEALQNSVDFAIENGGI